MLKNETKKDTRTEGASAGLTHRSEAEMFNSRERSLQEIWEALERRLPFIAASYEMAEGMEVVVTRMDDGFACGFPLWEGVRGSVSWYGEEERSSVRIPEGDARKWVVRGMPFDDIEKVLFRYNFVAAGTAGEKQETEGPEEEEKGLRKLGRKTSSGASRQTAPREVPPVLRVAAEKDGEKGGDVPAPQSDDVDEAKVRAQEILARMRGSRTGKGAGERKRA